MGAGINQAGVGSGEKARGQGTVSTPAPVTGEKNDTEMFAEHDERTKTALFLEKFGINVVLGVVPNAVRSGNGRMSPKRSVGFGGQCH
jgi:hypothetical protein